MQVAAATTAPPLDTEELLGRCLGKSELVQRVLGRFQRQLTEDLTRIAAAVAAADAAAVAKFAHRIKGAAANVSAHAVRQQAAVLEAAARAEAWDQIRAELDALTLERDEFDSAWQQLAWNSGT